MEMCNTDVLGIPSLVGSTVSFQAGGHAFASDSPTITIVEDADSSGCSTNFSEVETPLFASAASALNSGEMTMDIAIGSGDTPVRVQLDTGSSLVMLETSNSKTLGECWMASSPLSDTPSLQLRKEACPQWDNYREENEYNLNKTEGAQLIASSLSDMFDWVAHNLMVTGYGGAELGLCGLYDMFDPEQSTTFSWYPASATLSPPEYTHSVPKVPSVVPDYPSCDPGNTAC